MGYLKILQEFLFKNSKGSMLILSALVGFNIYQIEQINITLSPVIERATTEYPYDVLSFELRDFQTEQGLVGEVSKWVVNEESDKVGAMRTLCRISPNRLGGLMTPETITKVCRITR